MYIHYDLNNMEVRSRHKMFIFLKLMDRISKHSLEKTSISCKHISIILFYSYKISKYQKTILFNFKKNLIHRISLNSIILSIKSVVLIVQILKKISLKEIKDIVRKYQETHSFCYGNCHKVLNFSANRLIIILFIVYK